MKLDQEKIDKVEKITLRNLENKEYINEIDYDEIGKDIRFGIYD